MHGFAAVDDIVLRMHFTPSQFIQVHGQVNQDMVGAVVTAIDPRTTDIIVDLYCGLGNISLSMAAARARVPKTGGCGGIVKAAGGTISTSGCDNGSCACISPSSSNGASGDCDPGGCGSTACPVVPEAEILTSGCGNPSCACVGSVSKTPSGQGAATVPASTSTLAMESDRVLAVVGVDMDDTAIDMANYNARFNGLSSRTHFFRNDLTKFDANSSFWKHVSELRARFPKAEVKVVCDPSRSGVLDVLQSRLLSEWQVRTVVYVSCSVESLARDATLLVRGHKFEMDSIQLFDMFPHTTHVETVSVFNR
jgi:tRNA/tmRNA/rRNA uracil-C5-methylase (TrmA/RlmC/RlmD family)